MTEIDIPWIINHLGGVPNIARLYKKHLDIDMSIKTIEKWRERNSLPLTRYFELNKVAKAEGKTLNKQDYNHNE